jgi:CBS domain-containing protein
VTQPFAEVKGLATSGIEESMALMSERRIRHAPVVDGGALVGMISIGDLVKFQSRQQSFQLKYLNDYITAR